MAAQADEKAVVARVGRSGLLKALRMSAGANLMEANYQKAMMDLQVKAQIEGMAKEVADLTDGDKMAEILSRFILVMLTLSRPEQQPLILWHLYTHMRSTGLLEAVKPKIGSLVGLDGKHLPPKEES